MLKENNGYTAGDPDRRAVGSKASPGLLRKELKLKNAERKGRVGNC
jgi:hypothetical protein